jgi:hypothetical protein
MASDGAEKNGFFPSKERFMRDACGFAFKKNAKVGVCAIGIYLTVGIVGSCGGGSMTSMQNTTTGMISVSISDPPSCKQPNGSFAHVYITVRSVQAHIDPNASDSTPGWQELAPQLVNQPMQIDLFSATQTNCVLAQLGSASLPAGSYQQIRLLLLANAPPAGSATPASNACAGSGYNCAVLADASVEELQLSSQENTGLKIPPGQIVGGPIQVMAGESVDLNIDFNACASIVQEGNGKMRLKPTLTAGQVSPNNSGIAGQVVDSVTKAPIAGTVLVAVEQPDKMGVDRIVMEAGTDGNGNFRFCPLPPGPFDVLAVAVGTNNLPYNATAVVNVPNGTNLAAVPLVAEVGASAPAILQGFVTASGASSSAMTDVSLSALQSVSFGTNPVTMRQLTIPLQSIAMTSTSPAVNSTGLISVASNTDCPTGSPLNVNCAQYTLVAPGSNPNVGLFSSSGFSYSAPASGDVLFSVDAIAAIPDSGGVRDCTPSELLSSTDISNQPLKVTAGTTTNVARTDFTGCS